MSSRESNDLPCSQDQTNGTVPVIFWPAFWHYTVQAQSVGRCARHVRSVSTFGWKSMKLIGPGPVSASTPKKYPVGKSGLKLPIVFEPGVSPLATSAFRLNRGLSGIVGT